MLYLPEPERFARNMTIEEKCKQADAEIENEKSLQNEKGDSKMD